MVNKILLFLDTESTIFENERVVYDISITVVEQNQYNNNVKFSKSLRNRDISEKNVFTKLHGKNILIDEYAHLVPDSKKTTYGYANYHYVKFSTAVNFLKILCDYYKPDAIVGYNFQADFEALKNTQSVLKTSSHIYMRNEKLSSDILFKQNVCPSFDDAYKTDLMLYFSNHCPKFITQQENFAIEHKLLTPKGFTSRRLIDMYRFSTQNPNIEQMHMGYYDNMYAIKCMEKCISTDGLQFFPKHCMTRNDRKRKHFQDSRTEEFRVLYKYSELPTWFNDQYQNSKCLSNESIIDIRKFHPDFGGLNKQNAPYFRGEISRSGIWPPNNYQV